jgi:hypothetical protein
LLQIDAITSNIQIWKNPIVIDENELLFAPSVLLAKCSIPFRVNTMTGTNMNEYVNLDVDPKVVPSGLFPNLTQTVFDSYLTSLILSQQPQPPASTKVSKNVFNQFAQQYRVSSDGYDTYYDAFLGALTDVNFECANRKFAIQLQKSGVDVYRYRYAHDPAIPLEAECKGKACHGAEIPFIFQHPAWIGSAENTFSQRLLGIWITMARQRHPSIPTINSAPASNPFLKRSSTNIDFSIKSVNHVANIPSNESKTLLNQSVSRGPNTTAPTPAPAPNSDGQWISYASATGFQTMHITTQFEVTSDSADATCNLWFKVQNGKII